MFRASGYPGRSSCHARVSFETSKRSKHVKRLLCAPSVTRIWLLTCQNTPPRKNVTAYLFDQQRIIIVLRVLTPRIEPFAAHRPIRTISPVGNRETA